MNTFVERHQKNSSMTLGVRPLLRPAAGRLDQYKRNPEPDFAAALDRHLPICAICPNRPQNPAE